MTRKSVIVEPEYHGRGDKNTITYHDLIIPVILHRAVGGSHAPRFPCQKRLRNERHLNLATEVLKDFSPRVFNSP